jgi:multiple sugar transport system substrate-binding protein
MFNRLNGTFQKNLYALRQQYDMPGFLGPNKEFSYGLNVFAQEQRLAMHPNWIIGVTDPLAQLEKNGKSFDWDMVSYLAYDDRPKLGRQVDFHLFMIPPASKNKEAAFEVMRTLLSEEAQRSMNQEGRLTVLNNPDLREQFASNTNVYKGKNLKGIFKVSPSPAPMSTI